MVIVRREKGTATLTRASSGPRRHLLSTMAAGAWLRARARARLRVASPWRSRAASFVVTGEAQRQDQEDQDRPLVTSACNVDGRCAVRRRSAGGAAHAHSLLCCHPVLQLCVLAGWSRRVESVFCSDHARTIPGDPVVEPGAKIAQSAAPPAPPVSAYVSMVDIWLCGNCRSCAEGLLCSMIQTPKVRGLYEAHASSAQAKRADLVQPRSRAA